MKAMVKNWAEFQHYKDRSPPWLKLHRSLLDDFDYQRLPIASKALAPMIWLIAAESKDGEVDVSPDYLSFRLRWPVEEVRDGLSALIEKGFLIIASGTLADCYQDATPEREGETERETEEAKEPKGSLSATADVANCPHEQIVALYHEILPTNPRIKVWDGDRATRLRARWREDGKRQSLDYWRRFFTHIAASQFLTGRAEGKDGRTFAPGLDWMVKAGNFAKIIENRYHDRGTP